MVTLDIVHFNKLLHFEMSGDENEQEMFQQLVLIALALKECSAKLQEEYRSTPPPESNQKWYLPCATPDFGSGDALFELHFKGKLDRINNIIPSLRKYNFGIALKERGDGRRCDVFGTKVARMLPCQRRWKYEDDYHGPSNRQTNEHLQV